MKSRKYSSRTGNLMNWLGVDHGNNKRCLIVCIISTLMIVSGVLIMYYKPLHVLFANQLKLTANSLLFNIFQHPPIDVTISVFVFNVTNAEAFLAGKEKLKVTEVGPYVYLEDIYNRNPVINENGTVTFTTQRFLSFRRDLSYGDPEEDFIISPNIPLLGISSFLKDKSMISNLVVAQIANMLNTPQFVNLTVHQYLWGYKDKLVTLANKALPNWIDFHTFGIMDRLMAMDNSSNVITIKGNDEPIQSAILNEANNRSPFTVVNFNGSPGLHHWGYDDNSRNETNESNNRCNSIEGVYETGLFDPAYINETTDVWFYRRAFCRAVPMEYVGRGRYQNFATINMRLKDNFLDLPADNHFNECYCRDQGVSRCRYRGIGFLSPCYYGIPITISKPHYLGADPALLAQVDGLSPDPDIHDTRLSISETIGVPVDAAMKIQINLYVDTRLTSRCKPFNGMMLPLFWLELKTRKLSWIIYAADYTITYFIPILSGLISWLLVIFGSAITATAALFTFYREPNHGFEDVYDNKIGYSPIRVLPIYTSPSIRDIK